MYDILYKIKKQKGFTLAEVLVTLAVIGIVAALTIPSLIKSYSDMQTKSALKKVFSTMQQAYKMAIADNGGNNYACSYNTSGPTVNTGCVDLWNAMKDNLKAVKECNKGDHNTLGKCIPASGILNSDGSEITGGCSGFYVANQNNSYAMVLNNGQYIFMYNPSYPLFAFDVNGFKGDNNWKRDIFTFQIMDNQLQLLAGGCGGSQKAIDILLNK